MTRGAACRIRDERWPLVNWRKIGIGFSIEFGDPAYLRLWIGPVRIGWKWGRNV